MQPAGDYCAAMHRTTANKSIFYTLGILILSLVMSALVPTAALAQKTPAPVPASAQALDAAALSDLVRTIEDPAEREKLLTRLKALVAAQEKKAVPEENPGFATRIVDLAADRAKEISDHLTAAINADIPKVYQDILAGVKNPETRSIWVALITKLAIVLAVGFVAGWIIRLLLRRPRAAVEARETDSLWLRAPFLLVRTIIDLVPVLIFVAAAQAALPYTEPSMRTREVAVALINAYLIASVIIVIARMLLVPKVSGLRLLAVADNTSNYIFIWVRRFTDVWVYGFFLVNAATLVGGGLALSRLLEGTTGLLLLGMGVMFILQNRQNFGDFIRGNGDGRSATLRNLRARLGDIWHALAVVYLFAVYTVWLIKIEGGFEFILRATVLTIVIFIAAHIVIIAISRAIIHGFSLGDDLKEKYPSLEERANRYLPVLKVTLRWGIYIISVLAILSVWGLDVPGWLRGPSGTNFISAVVSIVIVIVAALIFWEGISSAIERYLNRATDGEIDRARRIRAQTLLPLLRKALSVLVFVMVALVTLSELGVNIAPLLAGAGVAGIAIGFGAQKLVQDVITGAFILFEDSMAVGDVVNVAGAAGVVEAVSIRSIRLRDLSGNVHTIPFSEIKDVTNMTKDFSNYVFEIGIAYRESVDHVIEVLKELAAEFEKDPEFGPLILAPFEVMGLDKFGDSAIVIKARYRTIPVKQWFVGREFNRRIKNKFDELGIEIPFPHTTVYFGEDKEGKAPPVYVENAPQERVSKVAIVSTPTEGSTPTDTATESGQADSDGE